MFFESEKEGDLLLLNISQKGPTLCEVVIEVPLEVISPIYRQFLVSYSDQIKPQGFHKSEPPLSYVEKNLKKTITEHLKGFLLWYPVISFFYKELRNRKVICAGEPRLKDIYLDLEVGGKYTFEFTPASLPEEDEWKYLPFKPPKRKRYKDLDKQATLFLQEETMEENPDLPVEIGAWICFDLWLVNKEGEPVLETFKESLWLKIGNEEASVPFQELFVGRKVGDKFCTKARCLHEYFNNRVDSCHTFGVEIKDILGARYFSIDLFKKHFNVKTNKKAHQKAIEVFSFRSDISLRRAIVEEALHLLLNKFPIMPPEPAVFRQQQSILDDLQNNPDYSVYKSQKGFQEKVYKLAKKQIRETILIDFLSYMEGLDVTHEDVVTYLNLSKGPRTKEFLFFRHPILQANDQEMPVSSEVLKQYCLREKMLNYAIEQLSKY